MNKDILKLILDKEFIQCSYNEKGNPTYLYNENERAWWTFTIKYDKDLETIVEVIYDAEGCEPNIIYKKDKEDE